MSSRRITIEVDEAIGELEVAAVRHAAGDAAHPHTPREQLASQQERGRLSVDRWWRGDDDLTHAVFSQSREQLLERQLVGADAV